MNILVIGGNGFVGKHLVNHLVVRNHKVKIIDLVYNPNLKKIDQIIGDFNDNKILEKGFKNIDVVYHLGGLSDLNDTLHKPIETVNINIIGTINVLEACKKYKIKRFIYSSTVYVNSNEGGFYKSSKIAAENYIREYSKLYGIRYTILRYGSLYGDRADKSNGLRLIIKNAVKQL